VLSHLSQEKNGEVHVVTLVPSVSRTGAGVMEFTRGLARSLEELRYIRLDVVALRDEYSSQDASLWNPVIPTLLDTRGPGTFRFAPTLIGWLTNARPDVIHLHGLWMFPSLATLRVRRRIGCKVVISTHGMLDQWGLSRARFKKVIAGLLYEYSNISGAKCIHALTTSEARSIRAFGYQGPICVIPSGIDKPVGEIVSSPNWRRLVENKRVFLYLGRLHPIKGLDRLIRAWKIFIQSREEAATNCSLVIAGWGDSNYVARLEKLVNELRIASNVFFIGPQFGKDKADTYAHSDVVILPSHSEGLPMTILEAWSYAKPTLMTAACNLGVGFEAGAAWPISTDPVVLAKQLGTCAEYSTTEIRNAGMIAQALVQREFSWERAATDMSEVYKWICNAGLKPSCLY
jgi:glycosyltransferase involved in cell wall biosynthesis